MLGQKVIENKTKEEFKVSVTFDKNGRTFQEVVESILFKRINENWKIFLNFLLRNYCDIYQA